MRLALTLILTLCVIAAAQYLVTGPRLVERTLNHEIERYQADAAGLAEIYATHHHEGWQSDYLPVHVREVLTHMGPRPDVRLVRMITEDGLVAAAAVSQDLGTTYVVGTGAVRDIEGLEFGDQAGDTRMAMVDRVLASGQATTGPEPVEHLGQRVYHVAAPMGEFSFVLEVVTTDDVVADQQRDLNRLIGMMLAIGTVLGVPIFYFAGGRGLNRRHAVALRHSSATG